MTFDLILSGGQLLDGTGTPAVAADLGIIGEKIEAIGDLSRAQARRVIPLQGLTLAPGFIDTHTHSEGALLHDPQHANGLRQGITTEIVGLDGMSWAPLSPPNFRLYARYLGGILGDPPPELDMSSIAAFRAHYHRKAAVNVACLVPHGALRLELLGFRDLPLREEALQTAGRMVRQGIEQGAVGFSTGAAYYPGYWADTRELVELCRAVRRGRRSLRQRAPSGDTRARLWRRRDSGRDLRSPGSRGRRFTSPTSARPSRPPAGSRD